MDNTINNSGALDFDTVSLSEDGTKLRIIDQTLLPNEIKFLELSELQDIREAIYMLRVRGAPAIGVAAAFGLYIAALRLKNSGCPEEEFFEALKKDRDYLAAARPTAVNLKWALDKVYTKAESCRGSGTGSITESIRKEAGKIRDEDIESCRRIGEYGLTVLKKGWGILTHCNAGHLAAVRYGTATAPIYLGHSRGYNFKVYADETRPLLQGARLTSFELERAGIDVTLICDNMASHVMKQGFINAVITGCDRVAANGDAANKIGTSGVAIIAAHYGIPFYIASPASTIDLSSDTGEDIVIEERDRDEIKKMWYKKPMAPEGVKAYNPAFDVTDSSLITGIITDFGIAYPPYGESLRRIKRLSEEDSK